jgi:hypothetical protein
MQNCAKAGFQPGFSWVKAGPNGQGRATGYETSDKKRPAVKMPHGMARTG